MKSILLIVCIFLTLKAQAIELVYESKSACPAPTTLQCAAESLERVFKFRTRSKTEGLHVYQWLVPLRPGQVLSSGISFVPEAKVRILSPAWLFFVDHQPGALFEHKTEFVLVDTLTGNLRVYASSSWPVVDDLHLFSSEFMTNFPELRVKGFSYNNKNNSLSDEKYNFPPPTGTDTFPNPVDWEEVKKTYPKSKEETERHYQLRVQGYLEKPVSESSLKSELNKCQCPTGTPAGKKLALVVGGGRLPTHYAKELSKALKARGYETWTLLPEYPFNLRDPRQSLAKEMETNLVSLKMAFAALQKNITGCCDEVFIYINAHGGPSASMDINPFSKEPKLYEDGPNRGKPMGGVTVATGSKLGGTLRSVELAAYLNNIKSCKTKLYLNSCYSGSHFTKTNINAIPGDVKSCMCRTIYTSASSRQPSWTGQEFDFVDAIRNGKSFEEAVHAQWREMKKLSESARSADELKEKVDPRIQSTDCLLCDDRDGDGLNGYEEIAVGTDPNRIDTDGDGLSDYAELRGERRSDPTKKDTDNDGLSDGEEIERGTDPANADTDGDGVSDQNEIFGRTDPLNPDSDGDGLRDGEEYERRTLPNQADTDQDGLTDGQEVKKYKTNPLKKDSDNDGVSDAVEVAQGTDPNNPRSF